MNPPDYVIAGFISKTYAQGDEHQEDNKQGWEDLFENSDRPVSIAWTWNR
jgi:hypothetical protein